jgi:hypothetical protein
MWRTRKGGFVSVRKYLPLSFHKVAAVSEYRVVSISFFFAIRKGARQVTGEAVTGEAGLSRRTVCKRKP